VLKQAVALNKVGEAKDETASQQERRLLADQARQRVEVERDRELAAKVQAQAESSRHNDQINVLQGQLLDAQAELAKARTKGLDDANPDVRDATVADILRAQRP
jgi:hypothetical protein